MTDNIHIITLGHDCSPAGALRNINMRFFALPFDWVVSNLNGLERCFTDDFKYFHRNLTFNHDHKRLIDEYGFEFPHDYSLTTNNIINENEIGEGVIGENTIIDNWNDYHQLVIDKYNRRIERFREIMSSHKPIIVLCRYDINDVFVLQKMLLKHFNKHNIYFVNSNYYDYTDTYITSINTECNGNWNDANIWKKAIDDMIKKIKE